MSKAFNIIQRGSLAILAINNGGIVYKAKTESLNDINPDFADLVVNDYAMATVDRGIVLGAAPHGDGYTVSVLLIDANDEPLPIQPEQFTISVDNNKLGKDVWCDDENLVMALRDKINTINNRQLQKLQDTAADILAYVEKVKMAESISMGVSAPTPVYKSKTKTSFDDDSNEEVTTKPSDFAAHLSKEANEKTDLITEK